MIPIENKVIKEKIQKSTIKHAMSIRLCRMPFLFFFEAAVRFLGEPLERVVWDLVVVFLVVFGFEAAVLEPEDFFLAVLVFFLVVEAIHPLLSSFHSNSLPVPIKTKIPNPLNASGEKIMSVKKKRRPAEDIRF